MVRFRHTEMLCLHCASLKANIIVNQAIHRNTDQCHFSQLTTKGQCSACSSAEGQMQCRAQRIKKVIHVWVIPDQCWADTSTFAVRLHTVTILEQKRMRLFTEC